MLIENCDYFIRYRQLPSGIYAFVMLNDDGTYTIVLDPRRSREEQMNDCSHEIWHIMNDHMFSSRSVQEIENEMQAV